MTDADSSIERLAKALRTVGRHWVLVAGLAVACGGIAFAFSSAQDKQYDATASLLFRDAQFDQKLFGSTFFAANRDPDRDAVTNTELVSVRGVADRASKLLDGAFSARQLRTKVTITSAGRSDVVMVTARDRSPHVAAVVANAWAAAFIEVRREADRAKVAEAQRLIETSIAELPAGRAYTSQRRSLVERREQLQIMSSLQTGNAEVAQRAEPPQDAVSPRPTRTGALGALLGLMLGTAIALVRESLDRRLKTPEQARDIYDRPILGTIAPSVSLADAKAAQRSGKESVEGDSFRLLLANLQYFNVDRTIRSVAVTSPAPGDGKSTIAAHLALASARSGSSTLIIEADLRRPTLAAKLGHDGSTKGLTQFLTGQSGFDESVTAIEVDSNGTELHAVFAGPLPPNSADLLESKRMVEFLELAEASYDFVVVDTSPVTLVPDSIPVLQHTTGVLVVVRLDKSRSDESVELNELLENLNITPLGVVVNCARGAASSYYGYYEQVPVES